MEVRARSFRTRSGRCRALLIGIATLLAVLPACAAAASPEYAGPTEEPVGPPAPGPGGEAGTQVAYAGILPGSILYRLKLALEQIRLWLTRSAEGQANYLIELINRRSAEIAEMVRTGRTKLVETVAKDQERLIRQVQDKVKGLEIKEEKNLDLLGRVEEAVGGAWDTLAGAVSSLPEKTKGAVNGIMHSLSQRARDFWDSIEKAVRGAQGGGVVKGLLERLKPGRDWRNGQPEGQEGKGPQGK